MNSSQVQQKIEQNSQEQDRLKNHAVKVQNRILYLTTERDGLDYLVEKGDVPSVKRVHVIDKELETLENELYAIQEELQTVQGEGVKLGEELKNARVQEQQLKRDTVALECVLKNIQYIQLVQQAHESSLCLDTLRGEVAREDENLRTLGGYKAFHVGVDVIPPLGEVSKQLTALMGVRDELTARLKK